MFGVDGDYDWLTWASITEMQDLAELHGVSKDIWPIYPGYEIETEIPLEEAQELPDELRIALESVDPRVIEENYWLNYINKILQKGNSFFIMP